MGDAALEQWTQNEQWTVLDMAERQQTWFVLAIIVLDYFAHYRERGAELMNTHFADTRGDQFFTATVGYL